jgi:Secretion system C-terminal sorting domain
MKTLYFLFIICFCLQFSASSKTTIFNQMAEVNPYWHCFKPKIIGLQNQFTISNEQKKIKTHLLLVEQYLRKLQKKELSSSQLKNRLHCLTILRQYALKGLFPQNTNHPYQRIPYFIDKANTPCAVGHLIIETGFENLAKQINTENNNGYLKDLANQYPAIIGWANKNGFEVNELAWIQPGYLFNIAYSFPFTLSDTNVLIHPSCAGKNDGMIKIDSNAFAASPKPLKAIISYAQQPLPYIDTNFSFYARKYWITVTDGANVSTDIIKTLIDLPSTISATIDTINVGCNYLDTTGKIEIKNVIGGTSPYTYRLEYTEGSGSYVEPNLGTYITDTNSKYNNLFATYYRVYIKDANGCATFQYANIKDSSAYGSLSPFYITPNNCITNSAVVTFYTLELILNSVTFDTLVLPVGTHSIILSNLFGCTRNFTFSISPKPWQAMFHDYNPILCNSDKASIGVDLPILYNYEFLDKNYFAPFTGIGRIYRNAGENIFIVKDKFECPDTLTFTIKEPEKLQNQTIFSPIKNSRGTTKIENISSGGTPPYSYNFANESLLSSGNYEIETTDANGCKIQNSISILEPNMAISPNPFFDKIKITGIEEKNKGSELLIFDMLGKLIFSEKIMDSEMEIDMQHLPKGIYIFKIAGQEFSMQKR